jgi:hypothetical protein
MRHSQVELVAHHDQGDGAVARCPGDLAPVRRASRRSADHGAMIYNGRGEWQGHGRRRAGDQTTGSPTSETACRSACQAPLGPKTRPALTRYRSRPQGTSGKTVGSTAGGHSPKGCMSTLDWTNPRAAGRRSSRSAALARVAGEARYRQRGSRRSRRWAGTATSAWSREWLGTPQAWSGPGPGAQ